MRLRVFPADEIVISTHPPERSRWLEHGVVDRAREQIDLPITHVVVDLTAESRSSLTSSLQFRVFHAPREMFCLQESVTMEALMERRWTDDRLDDFRRNVDARFDRVEDRLERIEARLDGMQRKSMSVDLKRNQLRI